MKSINFFMRTVMTYTAGVTESASHLSSGKWEAFFFVGELFRISFHMNYEVEAGVRGEPIPYGGDGLSKQECVSNSTNNKQCFSF